MLPGTQGKWAQPKWGAAEEETTASWSGKKTVRRVRRDKEDPSCTE